MTPNSSPPELPPVLALLRNTPPGALYSLVDKSNLLEGAIECLRSPITGAEWSADGTSLTIDLYARHRLTLAAAGERLETECSCRGWAPVRQCPHVAAAWAILKRLVSPGALSQIRFNERHLQDVARLVGLGQAPTDSPQRPAPRRPVAPARYPHVTLAATTSEMKKTAPRPYRLVLEEGHGQPWGSIRCGDLPLYNWTSAPADLQKFQSRHYFFEPTISYLHDFATLSGNYPIVLRRKNGEEVALAYEDASPLSACVTFAIDGGAVTVTRGFADDTALGEGARIMGECLFDPVAGSIRPVTGIGAWGLWESAQDEILAAGEMSGAKVRRFRGGVTVSASLFNHAALRIHPERIPEFAACCRFLAGGVPADPSATAGAAYFLEILSDLESETIRLAPMGDAGGFSFPFSGEMFRLLDPARRSVLSQPLKTKKRLTAIIEGCFSALEASSASARAAAVRRALASPDFVKRKVKSEASRLIADFVKNCAEPVLLLHAAGDGWRFTSDERKAQVRLIETIYRLFGIDPFVSSDLPGGMELPRSGFLQRLGELAATLQTAGFGLRFRGEPLTTGSWNFFVEASRHAIDWFELNPEIRCNGELLAEEDILAVLEGGVLRQGNACYLLDDEQRRILQLLFGGTAGKGKKRRKSEPVRIPRLQILDWLELRAHGVTLRLPAEDERLLANLTRLERIPERRLPAGLKTMLRPYQHEGYEWLSFLYEHRFGACLADDMGLGKTVQTIAFLGGIAEGQIDSAAVAGMPHLIVVPPSLLFNWESELARFYPALRIVSYTGPRRTLDFSAADIVLTSYGILQRDIETLETLPFNVVIFDEAQQVKNIQTATTGAARRINGRFKLALTGTPMENHLGEYFAIMDLCVPGLLGPYQEFKRRIDIRGTGGGDTLIRRTRPFVLRRSKQMIADELPPRIEMDLYLELTPKQRALYQRTVEEVRGAVDEAFRAKAAGQARMIALTAILRLRQICLSAALVTAGVKGESPKQECLADNLLELRDEGHSALVFSQFTSYLDLVEEGLKQRGLATLRLDGSTPVPRRKELVRQFQQSEEPLVFLISLKAGGKGLNLTRATYVYHLDPWWNPAVENQASDRAHRIGQTAQVTVNRLLMRHTVEEKMMALKERKLKLYRALLDDTAGVGGVSLSKEDFDFLLAP